MKTLLLIATVLIANNIHAQSTNWYEIPMNNATDFENIQKRTLEETWSMTKIPEYHNWVLKNLQTARELGWRPGHHKPNGTCYACHALKPETYERLSRLK